MERKIGEIFEHNSEWYQCVKGDCCRNCDFYDKFKDDICFAINNCSLSHRSDKTSVIFKKLKRLGEPYIIGNKLIQRYKIYPTTSNINVYGWYYQNLDVQSWTIDIELKRNKENMEEEKEYSEEEFKNNPRFQNHKPTEQVIDIKKVKPFDLQKAKAGKPVCTRDGRKARIICFNAKGTFPIIALVDENAEEFAFSYTADGKYATEIAISNKDLMMFPEKKEGWVNVYKDGLLDTRAYNTKKEAFDNASPCDYVDTVRISWGE